MKDALTKLIKVKTIVTIMITVVFVILALKGTVTPEYVMTIVTTVIAFYFGTQTEKKNETTTDDTATDETAVVTAALTDPDGTDTTKNTAGQTDSRDTTLQDDEIEIMEVDDTQEG